MRWYNLTRLLTTHKYKPNTQLVNSSTHFMCSHTVLHIRIVAEMCHTPYVSLQSPLSCLSGRFQHQTNHSSNWKCRLERNVLEKRISFGKILPVFSLQSELKNTCGFENVANHISTRQLIEGKQSSVLSQHASAFSAYTCKFSHWSGQAFKSIQSQVKKVEAYDSCDMMLLLQMAVLNRRKSK